MKRLFTIMILCLPLVSCGTDANIYGSPFGQKIVGNKNYVSISNVWNEMDALPTAEKHCALYNKSADFDKMVRYRAVYKCVK